jgi:hypothetical protein
MPYDGSGNFTRVHNWVVDKNNSIKIQAVRMDGECDDYATAFNSVILRSGVVPMAGDLKLGTNRITGLHAGTVGSPSFQPAVDPTTGLYFPAAGVIGFVISGAEIARLNSTGLHLGAGFELITGSMGIDTATPRTPLDVNGITSVMGIFENATVVAAALTGVVQWDYLSSAVKIMTANAIANFSFNIRGDGTHTLDSIMATGQALTMTVEVPMGVTPYYCTTITVDGSAPSELRWVGGAPTAGAASQVNAYTVTVIKTGAATFLVRASLVSLV